MKYVTANEIKRNGVSVVNEAVAEYGEAIVTFRGHHEYVIVDTERYNYLHKLKGSLRDIHSVSINTKYRITIEFIIRDKMIIPIRIGSHDEVC